MRECTHVCVCTMSDNNFVKLIVWDVKYNVASVIFTEYPMTVLFP